MPSSPSESLLLFTPWNQLNFYVTGFKNTQASRDNRSCHFHAQLCRCTESATPALSRASSRRLNDAFNISSLAHDNRLVFNAKTRSSVPSAPQNRHYQCTHEFSRVSGHFTHCWAYRPVDREMNSLVVKVSKLIYSQPYFLDSRTCNLELLTCCVLYSSLLDLVNKAYHDASWSWS